jgi:hypothetical protein
VTASDITSEPRQPSRLEKERNTRVGGMRTGAAAANPPSAASFLVALVRVRLAAAGLGEAATDHVADGQNRGVKPHFLGKEAIVVAATGLGHQAGNQCGGENYDVRVELGRLDRGLVSVARRRSPVDRVSAGVSARGVVRSWVAMGEAPSLGGEPRRRDVADSTAYRGNSARDGLGERPLSATPVPHGETTQRESARTAGFGRHR